MRLDFILLENFRSVRKTQTFTFPKGPGLFFMYGDNQVEPRLGGNGAGKTTVWEALVWVLFGKTSRGLKAGDVGNWDVGKDTMVRLGFTPDDDSLPLFLERTWSPNTWVLRDLFGNVTDLTKDDTNSVLSLLGLGFGSFLASIIFAQKEPLPFLDLKPDERAALFSEVMVLDRWIDYSKQASDRAQKADVRARTFEAAVANLQGRLEALSDNGNTAAMEEWEKTREQQLNLLDKEHTALLARSQVLKERLKAREEHHEDARAIYRACIETQEDLDAKVKEADRRLREAQQALAGYRAVVGSLEQRQEDFDSGACPTCGQPIAAHIRRQVEATLLKHLDKVASAEKTVATLGAEADAVEAEAARLRKESKNIHPRVLDAEDAVKSARRELQSNEASLDNLEDRAEALEQEKNPYAKAEAARKARRAETVADLEDTRNKLDEVMSQHALYGYWSRWFKDIRLSSISDALEELEIEVNSCVNELGLTDWEILFDIDRETKAGTIKRGFHAMIRSPQNQKAVPWEAWSGGEAQRLRLAASMGLANLIRARAGVTLDLEVWDEPTQHMSPQGIQDLLEALQARAARLDRQIWIVDHNTLGYAGFKGRARVIKDSKGTRFDLSECSS